MKTIPSASSTYDAAYERLMEELRRVKERLDLTVFWRDHNALKLKEAMANANYNNDTEHKCACGVCVWNGRAAPVAAATEGEGCRFKKWFERKVASHGLTLGRNETRKVDHADADPFNPVFDSDHSLVVCEADKWYWATYGGRTWKASSVDDVELQKLHALFIDLNADAE
jgi:hypothetical protein